MVEHRVYYANQVHMDWFKKPKGVSILSMVGSEVYNGGYLRLKNAILPSVDHQWYRCDLTPVLLEEVPKELRLLELINP